MTTRLSEDTRAAIRAAWPAMLAELAEGGYIKAILKVAGFSGEMVRCYRETEPGAREQWQSARESSGDAFAERALEVATAPPMIDSGKTRKGKPILERMDAQHARTLVDTLKWAARVRNPRSYGDKAQLDVNVRTVDLTRIIEAANARLAAARPAPVIEYTDAELVPQVILPSSLATLI